MGWSEDGPALWDASTMKRLPMPDVKHEPRLGGATNELVAFSPDSKTLVFSRNKTLWLFDMSTATPTGAGRIDLPRRHIWFCLLFRWSHPGGS